VSKMLIVRPRQPTVVTASNGTGGSNVATPDPKEVWVGSSSPVGFSFDFGKPVAFDSLFIGFIGGVSAPSYAWSSGLAGGGEVVHNAYMPAFAPSSSAEPPRRHAFRRLAAPVEHRYGQVDFAPNLAGAVPTIGIIIFGLAFETQYNREKGGGRTVIDTGSVESLPGGGFGIGHGTRKGGFRWVFGDLSDAELDQLYDLALNRGNSRPLIAVEDPDATPGLNERIHYGLFERFEHYERGDPTKHRWGLSVTQWV